MLFLAILLVSAFKIYAQDLSSILDDETPEATEYTTSTFKGTRILNAHSVENRKKGTLDFLISHRFGSVSEGVDELFGLDQSNIRFAFEYAPIDNLTIGVGRSSTEKIYDAFFKYKLLKQSTGKKSFPFTASVFANVAYRTLDDNDLTFNQNLTYVSQILIARKFSPGFSLQLIPSYISRNSVRIEDDPHGIFTIGLGGRAKITKRMAINFEYHYVTNPLESIPTTDSLALGLEIETGGHVFQIILSNSIAITERNFLTESNGEFFEGDIHLGFNIARTFQVGNRNKRRLSKVQ